MHTEQKNTKKLKELYNKALTIKSAIPHPRILGIIRECGGKMHMHERSWSDAATDFFEVRLPPLRYHSLARRLAPPRDLSARAVSKSCLDCIQLIQQI